MAEVVLEHVSKSYDKTRVIEDISLSIRDKEFVVLVGPSGCGKSTVLRMIAGLETITDGTIKIGEKVVNDVPPKDRDIAMVFQNYALYPHMSVYDNMAFGLKMRKVPKTDITTKVKDAARILNLEDLLQRKPKQLSGGQRQRVALGRAIVRNPKVFLMDEPLSNLDAKLRVQMRSEIARLHQRLDATTIYVTHDQVEAMTMGDRIVILNAGKIQQVDTPLKVYHEPANMFVAGFIGHMNFLSGVLEEGGLRVGDGTLLPLPEKLAWTGGEAGGRGASLGLRPEQFQPSDAEGHPIDVEVERVELLGSEQMIHFSFAGQAMVARWPSDREVTPGSAITLKLALASGVLFDAHSEARMA